MRKHKAQDWEKDPCVEKWFNQKAPSTVKAYRSYFPKWLKFIGMTPTEQIEKRHKDDISPNKKEKFFFEDKWLEFKKELQTEYETREAIKSHLTTVRSFFSAHRLHLKLSREDTKIEVAQKIVKRGWVASNTELRVMYGMANTRDRALLLVLYQSGFSERDVEALNIEDFKLNGENKLYGPDMHVFIEKRREKTNVIQATCISFEALHDIKLMLRERANPKTGPLFLTPKGQRLTVRFINEAIKNLAKKAYPDRDFKTKSLRDSYNSGLLEANIQPQELKDVMMGHKRRGARGHYAYNEQTIIRAYEKAFRYLSINGGTQARADLTRIEETVTGLAELVTKQQKEIKTLKSLFEIKNLKALFEQVLDEYNKEKKTDEDEPQT